jgi:hypothetical protein
VKTQQLDASGSGSFGSFLTGLARGWDQFWFQPADPTTLCCMRILVGVLVLYVHISYSWGLLSFIGPEGWFDDQTAQWIRLEQPIMGTGWDWNPPFEQVDKGVRYWSVFFHVRDANWIQALHIIFLVCMALFTLGLWTRVTSVLTWIGAISYVQRAYITWFGMDAMMLILLGYLMLGPSGATLSLDRWLACRRARREGRPIPPVQPLASANFVIRLMQVHFCIIYLAGGTSKLLGSTWWSATSLNFVMLNYSFAPLDFPLYRGLMTFLAGHRWMWEIFITGGVVYTLCVEIGFPFLVWDRRWRWVMVCGSILLHTGIGLFMGLTAFSLFMLVFVSSFVPPEAIHRLFARVSSLLPTKPSGDPTPVSRDAKDLVMTGS